MKNLLEGNLFLIVTLKKDIWATYFQTKLNQLFASYFLIFLKILTPYTITLYTPPNWRPEIGPNFMCRDLRTGWN